MEHKHLIRLCAGVVYGYSRGVLRGMAGYVKANRDIDFDFIPNVEPGIVKQLSDQLVAGVVIQIRRPDLIQELRKQKIPFVNVSNVLDPLPPMPSVISDDAAVGRMAADYFLQRGFRHFAYWANSNFRYAMQRGEAFMAAIKAAGQACTDYPHELDGEVGIQRANSLRNFAHPLAIFCGNDASARQMVDQCVSLGLHVPDQVAILGVDNDEINRELSGVPLSSIRLGTEQIGLEAVSMLMGLIKGEAPQSEPMLIPPAEVITRRSTDSLALLDKEVGASVRFIRDRGGREINVQDLLSQTSLSRRSLEMRFRKALGRSPYQEIRRVQIERAKLLLMGADGDGHPIPDAFGYTELPQPSAAIHEKIVMPRQYRRRAKPS